MTVSPVGHCATHCGQVYAVVVGSAGGYTIIRPDAFEFTPPSKGDQSRGVMRLSELLDQSRANIWRMPPASKGRRHRESVQEEIFVPLEGTMTLFLGDPATSVELPSGAIAIVRPGTPVQLANFSHADTVVLIVGAPATVGDAEYLPDAALTSGFR
jgi:uncharacterized cupin superfamily protein